MRALGDIADKYDRGYGHFTTRQNIQYNWIKLEETPDMLADLAKVEMHAIQTSGNCIRNISSDQYAGAAADEIVDPRPMPNCCASGRASTPNSWFCRASSRSR
jgi:sulfite reductase (NADPH) hemoprotein beta-component